MVFPGLTHDSHMLGDSKINRRTEGDTGILLPLPPGLSIIHVALQGQHEVESVLVSPGGYRFPKMETPFKA